jgi:hypothetical protein
VRAVRTFVLVLSSVVERSVTFSGLVAGGSSTWVGRTDD